jgi:hypothetical protein
MRLMDTNIGGSSVPQTRTNILPFRPAHSEGAHSLCEDDRKPVRTCPTSNELSYLAKAMGAQKPSALWPQYLLDHDMFR